MEQNKLERLKQISPKEGFIYVPSIDLYFAKERTCLGMNWIDTWMSLDNQKLKMPTIHQFVEVLKYLEYPKGDYQRINRKEANTILKEILCRGKDAWLDACITGSSEYVYNLATEHVIDENRHIIPTKIEPLEKSLKECQSLDILKHQMYWNTTFWGTAIFSMLYDGRAFITCNRACGNPCFNLGVFATYPAH